ncbi:MAG TPA: PadR family transcriptional regulator [Acidimicrobiales bacterium]
MTVRSSLLALLAEAPATGYGLKQRYDERTGALWPVNIGQVYKTLRRLQEEGLVSRHGGDSAPYELTAAGRRDLSEWLTEPVPPVADRDELTVKVILACATPQIDAVEVIQRHRSALVEELQQVTRSRGAADENTTWLMLTDALVLRIDAAIRWLDRCEARLAQAETGAGR